MCEVKYLVAESLSFQIRTTALELLLHLLLVSPSSHDFAVPSSLLSLEARCIWMLHTKILRLMTIIQETHTFVKAMTCKEDNSPLPWQVQWLFLELPSSTREMATAMATSKDINSMEST
ncbi:unnamed protein product [Lathyrus sativus]|nr:unnamed protein product [Lathyrus sativus]